MKPGDLTMRLDLMTNPITRERLGRSIAELYFPVCRARFCDGRCKADAKRFSRISTITKVIDERRF
jgi:hypothetical protein